MSAFRQFGHNVSSSSDFQNPRLKRISFHIFCHWKVTTEYAKTKDILNVMKKLGHRDIKTTLLYTQLVHFESDDFWILF